CRRVEWPSQHLLPKDIQEHTIAAACLREEQLVGAQQSRTDGFHATARSQEAAVSLQSRGIDGSMQNRQIQVTHHMLAVFHTRRQQLHKLAARHAAVESACPEIEAIAID